MIAAAAGPFSRPGFQVGLVPMNLPLNPRAPAWPMITAASVGPLVRMTTSGLPVTIASIAPACLSCPVAGLDVGELQPPLLRGDLGAGRGVVAVVAGAGARP